jgi:hypothetical protein
MFSKIRKFTFKITHKCNFFHFKIVDFLLSCLIENFWKLKCGNTIRFLYWSLLMKTKIFSSCFLFQFFLSLENFNFRLKNQKMKFVCASERMNSFSLALIASKMHNYVQLWLFNWGELNCWNVYLVCLIYCNFLLKNFLKTPFYISSHFLIESILPLVENPMLLTPHWRKGW